MSYLSYKDSESHYSGPLPVKVNIMLLYKIPLYVGPRKMALFNNSPSYVPPSQQLRLYHMCFTGTAVVIVLSYQKWQNTLSELFLKKLTFWFWKSNGSSNFAKSSLCCGYSVHLKEIVQFSNGNPSFHLQKETTQNSHTTNSPFLISSFYFLLCGIFFRPKYKLKDIFKEYGQGISIIFDSII